MNGMWRNGGGARRLRTHGAGSRSGITPRTHARVRYTPVMPSYDYPRPALTVDVAVFRGEADERELLLVKRGQEPYLGWLALPGGFVDEGEVLRSAARRELLEETGLDPSGELVQVGTYGDPGRDPRGWTVSVVFRVVLGPADASAVTGGSDASEAAWHPIGTLPPLAFDHALIVADALESAASMA